MKKRTKQELYDLFGGQARTAEALGVTRHAVYLWPETLHQSALRRVRDYYLKTAGEVPSKWMP